MHLRRRTWYLFPVSKQSVAGKDWCDTFGSAVVNVQTRHRLSVKFRSGDFSPKKEEKESKTKEKKSTWTIITFSDLFWRVTHLQPLNNYKETCRPPFDCRGAYQTPSKVNVLVNMLPNIPESRVSNISRNRWFNRLNMYAESRRRLHP